MIKVVVLDFDGVVRVSAKLKDAESVNRIGFAYDELMTVLWESDAGRTLLCGQSSRDVWWESIQRSDARLQDVEQSFIWNDVFGS